MSTCHNNDPSGRNRKTAALKSPNLSPVYRPGIHRATVQYCQYVHAEALVSNTSGAAIRINRRRVLDIRPPLRAGVRVQPIGRRRWCNHDESEAGDAGRHPGDLDSRPGGPHARNAAAKIRTAGVGAPAKESPLSASCPRLGYLANTAAIPCLTVAACESGVVVKVVAARQCGNRSRLPCRLPDFAVPRPEAGQ